MDAWFQFLIFRYHSISAASETSCNSRAHKRSSSGMGFQEKVHNTFTQKNCSMKPNKKHVKGMLKVH